MKTEFFIIAILAAFMLSACDKYDTPYHDNDAEIVSDASLISGGGVENDLIVLGNKLNNPYSLTNMQTAYNQLYEDRLPGIGSNKPEPPLLKFTDIYVRFLPENEEQLHRLQDEDLELFTYPLDYEIKVAGNYYHDPSIPEGEITWLYTTVKPGYRFPSGIKYEILEYCYIPEDDDNLFGGFGDNRPPMITNSTKSGDESVNVISSYDLEYLAFKNTDNLDMWTGEEGLTKAAFKPTGRVTVYDTEKVGYVPVKGVKVRTHNIVKWDATYTDEAGYYTLNKKYRTNINYTVLFENPRGFTVWDNWAFIKAATYSAGWHSNVGYNILLGTNSKAWPWATVNNATYDYYDICDRDALPLPPPNLKIWIFNNMGSSSASMIRRVDEIPHINSHNMFVDLIMNVLLLPVSFLSELDIFLPDITIGASNPYDSFDYYQTVFHELSHASHYQQVGDLYWIDYINYILTYGVYGDNDKGVNAWVCGIGEMWAYAMGHIHAQEIYNKVLDVYPENQQYWFTPDIFYDLYKDGVFSKKEIFGYLTENIRTLTDLKDTLRTTKINKIDKVNTILKKYGLHDNYYCWRIFNDSDRDIKIKILTPAGIATRMSEKTIKQGEYLTLFDQYDVVFSFNSLFEEYYDNETQIQLYNETFRGRWQDLDVKNETKWEKELKNDSHNKPQTIWTYTITRSYFLPTIILPGGDGTIGVIPIP